MNEAAIIQLAISAIGVAGTMAGALVIISRRNGKTNGETKAPTCSRIEFSEHIVICNERWIENASKLGNIESKLDTIIRNGKGG
jgi:hypothetical protein